MFKTPQHPKTRGTKGFDLYCSRKAQTAILHLPDLQRRLVGERRAMLCEMLPHMVRAGISQNQIARAFGVPGSALSAWRIAYARGGIEAITPKPARRSGKGRAVMATLEVV
jgi:hypothetical protein